MPTMSNSHRRLPSFWAQIGDMIGTLSPIFQWKRSAVLRPTMAPVRVASQACFCSAGRTTPETCPEFLRHHRVCMKKFFGSW
jgi:hypothetical protein